MKTLIKYLKIWWMMSKNAFLAVLSQRVGFAILLIGKILRFSFFLIFLFFLLGGAKTLAGYNFGQVVFFFLTFNLIDIISQFLFREVYRFRPLIVSGGFDLVLSKPINSLFRVLMGGADIIDFFTIPPLIIAIVIFAKQLNPSLLQILLYVFLVVNGLLIATAFHIAVLSLGIITFEIDHTIMIYRDLNNLGRLPIDIYKQPLQGILTYLVPVGLMITLPAKAMMGLVTPMGAYLSFIFGLMLIFVAIRFWNFALKKYSSASS